MYLCGCFIGRDLIATIDVCFLILGKHDTWIFRAVNTMGDTVAVGTCSKRTIAAERKDVFRPTAQTMKGVEQQIDGKRVAVERLGFLS